MSDKEAGGHGERERGSNKRSYSDALGGGGGTAQISNDRPSTTTNSYNSQQASSSKGEHHGDQEFVFVMFHLYVDKNAEMATLMFEKPLKCNNNLTITMEKVDSDGHWTYFKSRKIRIHPNEVGNARYTYLVNYAPTRFQRLTSVFIDQDLRAQETSYRKPFRGNNQYDVFKDPKSNKLLSSIIAGQFFYIKMLYDQVEESGRNLKEMMIETEHVGFGTVSFVEEEKKSFFGWITNSIKSGLTPTKSAFLCALLGQLIFSGKRKGIRYCLSDNLDDGEQTVNYLLVKLRDCNKAFLPSSSLDFIKHIDYDLLKDSSFSTDLGYILTFCHLFDSQTVLERMKWFKHTFTNDFDEMAQKTVKRILHLTEKEGKEMLIKCIIERTPNISSLWKLSRILESQNAMMDQADVIADKFMFFTTSSCKKIDVFDKSIWHEAPHSLRGRIAVPFAEELKRRVERPGTKLDDEESLTNLMLDRDLQSGASAVLVDIMKVLSKSKSNLDVVCKILNSHNFLSFWKKTKKEDKEDIVCSLTLTKVKPSTVYSTRKDEVVKGFRALEELCQIACLLNHEDLLAKFICQEMQRCGLRSIVDAYDEIQKCMGVTGKKWHLKTLINTVQVEQAKPDVKSKLIDTIFPTLNSGTLLIDGGREEILLFLLNQTKLPSRSGSQSHQKTSNVITNVLSERKLWETVFQATGKVQRLHSHQMYLMVKDEIDSHSKSINDGSIPLGFFKSKDDLRNVAQLLALGRCYPSGCETGIGVDVLKDKWMQFLDSLSNEKGELMLMFMHLKDVIDLAKETADESGAITLVDLNTITKVYNDQKNSLRSIDLKDIRTKGYWGPLESLTKQLSEELVKLSRSTIFKNFAATILKEQGISCEMVQGSASDEEEENGVDREMTVEDVLLLLNNDGIKTFKDVLRRVADQGCSVTSKELDKLLVGIEASDIEREFKDVYMILNISAFSMDATKMLQNYVQFNDVERKLQVAMECLDTVGYEVGLEDEGSFQKTLHSFLNCKVSGSLKSISANMENPTIVKLNCQLSPDLVDILNELSLAKELIEFIITTAKDNMVDLVEAVEEHSDQLIQETTVSYLIDVHRFLRELLSNKPKKPELFLDGISQAYRNITKHSSSSAKTTKMAAKIKVVSCNVHSLRGLHMMLSNRGEMTKEIIKSAVNYGQYLVRINEDGSVEVQLTYKRQDQNNSEAKYNHDDLNDLRSRALLMVNADKSHMENVDIQASVISLADLRYFVEQVDLLTDIVRNYTFLKMSGMPDYDKSYWKLLKSMDEIKEEEQRISHEVECWNKMIFEVRQQHFFLNFVHTKHFWLLKSFFHKNTKSDKGFSDEVLAIFRQIDSGVNVDDFPYFHSEYLKSITTNTEHEVHAIGSALKRIFKHSKVKSLPVLEPNLVAKDAVVEPCKLYVGVLEPDSAQTVHVIMSLFGNTCARFPEPSQILFCNPQTTWDEIELLLLRTFEAHRHGFSSNLHCIANVECLPNDIQFKLVDTLKLRTSNTDAPYLLAIVCRGGPHHHIADQFSDYVHYHGGIPDADMRTTFEEKCPNTFLVTGDLPGLGKSEEISFHAGEKGKAVVTFPISGPFVRRDLVKRLSELKLKSFQSLHFDIGEVDNPAGLDTFLFELVVTKMVSSEALIFSLPTDHVYIEIANTLQQGMRNSLPVCKRFKRLKVDWKNYSNLRISEELTSPIQIVCHYLSAYESGKLEYQEVNLSGINNSKPLSSSKCQALLRKHFFPGGDPSFNILENFLSVLACQLLKFSRSPYFKPKHLKDMVGQNHDIRIRLFKALLEVSTSFAARSVNACKATQSVAISEVQAKEALEKMKAGGAISADEMVDRVKGMIQWSDNQQLVLMLHGAGSITAIYRDLKDVPKSVKDLFKSQAVHGKDLEDYSKMTQKELQSRLEKFSDAPTNVDREKLASLNYALTPDNLLKMALIIQRMQAGIPVIIMGETGCGKTSLVRYLAQTCDIPFDVLSFHAGITERQITEFIYSKDKEARNLQKKGKSMWVFLDEINTCDYLGTVNEIVCHRSIQGRPLASNLIFVAACNPYRLRPPGRIMTAGLTGKTSFDEFSKLVYRVHPLPETMIDYVWDYGSLNSKDERAYIGRMVERMFDGAQRDMLVDLLATSQQFIRDEDKSSFCVSLRDVHRATILMRWFYKTLSNRSHTCTSHPSHTAKYFHTAQQFTNTQKAIVLALAHCYLSRLPTTELRNSYCKQMTVILDKHGLNRFKKLEDSFQSIIRAEQEDYLLRMELPEGTAKNAALRENVFVILVCILNRIPVFIVGKPGCSKSLSMQIIRSNLRGRDSKDPFLKTLPQLMVVSFQGSESSTSEGIEKVFEKARKYQSKAENVLPVVLLDEIGLAEISKFNPLKVLHRLLEPGEGKFPDVAVVGISNWALDAAKMNRAIHLSRPEPDKDDLYETGLSIRNAQVKHLTRSLSSDPQIRCLAEAYHEYQAKQKHENFHGLRDYYSMAKCLSCRDPGENSTNIQRAMQRNFGGITAGKGDLQSAFLQKLKLSQTIGDVEDFHVTDLIEGNLNDRMARHLMLITNGDSAIGILDQTLNDLKKEKITIFGSRFEEDLSADYSHRILSRIILCMERNCILILRDLERIYGSLYDMLNQNYMVVGGKKNCRVALGAFSNPMCQVDDGFRCIVLVDEDKVDYSDPPFLNRFEKQLLRFSDILDDRQRTLIKEMGEWAESISSVHGHETKFDEFDMFAGFHEDTLPSVVLLHSKEAERSDEEVFERCKDDLMTIAMPDAVIRSRNSKLNQMNDEEVNELYHSYFEKPIHDGVKTFLEHTFENHQKGDHGSAGMKLLIMTHSSIHNDVSKSIEDLFEVQIEKLSFFKSEKELSKRLKYFWWESKANLLVVQCRPETDAPHMLLVKTIIEEQRTAFSNSLQSSSEKHVCIVVHLRRSVEEECDYRWQFNFLSGWSQVMIECLEKPVVLIREMLEYSVIDVLLNSETVPFHKVATDQVLWCFTQIRFPTTKPCNLDAISGLISVMTSCRDVMNCFMELCCSWIGNQQEGSETTWQIDVACDRQALINSSTLVKAMEYFIIHIVRLPLARIIYFLQKHSAFQALTGNDATRQECLKLISNESVFQINKIPPPQGAESLVVESTYANLRFPFSTFFCDRVDTLLDFFTDEHRNHCLEQENVDENGDLTSNARKVLVMKIAMKVEQVISEITDSPFLTEQLNEYIQDFLDIKTDDASDFLSRDQRIAIMKAHYGEKMPDFTGTNPADVSSVVAQLHCNFWIEDNAVPNVLYFIRECIDINIPGFNVEDLVSRYHGQEKRNMMTDDGEVSERNDENLEDNGLSQTDMEPAEGKDLCKLPEEHSENEDILTGPVQESHQCSDDGQSSGIQNEQASEKYKENVLGDFEGAALQQPQSQNSPDIESSGFPREQSKEKDKEMLVENREDKALQQPHTQTTFDTESSGVPQEQSKEKGKEMLLEDLEVGALQQPQNKNSSDIKSSCFLQEQSKEEGKEMLVDDHEDEALQQPHTHTTFDIESSDVPQEQSKDEGKEMLVKHREDEALQQPYNKNSFEIESSGVSQETSEEKNEEISAQNLEDETLQQTRSHENVDDAANTNSEQSTVDNAGDAESTFFPESVFEYFVVEDVCLSLIPTDNVIQLFGGISKWKSAVSLVLSSVSKYRIPIEVSYFLKVCNDFANLIPLETEPYSLFEIGERGKQVDNQNYLDSGEIFQSVCDSVQVLRDKGHDETKLNEFLFQFYERCIESNPDSPMMGEILSRVSLSEDANMLHLASSILHQILLSENDAFAPEHLEKLITSTELDEFPNLSEINFALSLLQENEKELDCHVNVICCDLINKLYFKDLNFQDVTSSKDALVLHFHQAVSILSETDENLKTTMFRFICAVAYLRAYMSELARLPSGETKTLDLVLSDICVHLQDGEELQQRKLVVWTFLIKELCQVMCLYDVKKLIQSNEKTHPLMSLEWKEEDTCKLEYNPFKLQTAKSKIATALGIYVESKDSKPFTDALDSIMTSCEKRQELAAIAIEMFYIVRSFRKLKDTEDSVAEFVTKRLTKCTLPYKNFISRISSRQSFQCKELEISTETTTIDFQVAGLVQHLCAILTSRFVRKSKNPIMCCLVDPKALKTSCMVALPDDNSGYPPYKHFKSNTACEVHLFSCKCGIRYVSRESAGANCPCCDSHKTEVVKCTGQKIPATKGYVYRSPEDLKCDLLHVRNLDPVEFRILHLIVHAALLGGYSLDLSTGVLSDVMGDENPSDTCYNIVQIDLEALSSLFCCKKEKIVTLLHHVIESVSQILTDNSGLPIPLDEKGRSSWEGYFSKKVKPVLEKFHCGGFVEKDNQQSYTAVIEERQLPQFADITSRNASIPRLFRVTQPNTFNKLREVYFNSPTELKEKHQLLGLFLDHHDTLHLIGNLVSLLSWSRRVGSLLSRAITRKDAKEKKIYDVVLSKESQTPNETKLSKAFEEFKKAWRKVVPLVNESIQDGDEMPYISEINPVGYCLAEKNDLGRYLCKSFYILAKMQNTFLDSCLAIASTGKCPALHFLSKEGSPYHLPIIHVQDAKKREIINYEWTDDFLAHSHCSTEYGQGKSITYDMTKMEKELAGCFLLGKAYLDTASGIHEFVFSKQLFHDCANILNELCESIPQDKLPSSVEAELNSSARKSMDRIQTLLGHMELVLWYLKRMEVKPDRSLVEFSDTCIPPSRVFPKDLLPTTLNTIQIRHVCALYEFVEDQLAAPSVECVEERYLQKMLDGTKKKLEENSATFEKVKLEAAITAIKRFVFRYLHMKPHPDESLVESMSDTSLWPMALRARSDDSTFEVAKEALKFFPKELTIGEIYEIHAFYENLLKKLNAKSAHPRPTILATLATRAPRTSHRPSKKRVMKSGGFS